MRIITAIVIIIFIAGCDSTNIHETVTGDKYPPAVTPEEPAAAPEGSFLTFDGSQNISVPHNTLLNFTTTMTIELWIRPDDLSVDQQIAGKWGTDSSSREYRLFFYSGTPNQIAFEIGDSDTYTDALLIDFDALGIAVNTWLHIAGVFDNGAMTLYVNGTPAGNTTSTITQLNVNIPGSYTFNIAHEDSGSNPLYAAIDEIRIWNTGRTDTEINTDYDHKVDITEPGLVFYMELNEGTGSTVTDSVNGLTATVTGTPAWGLH